MALPALTNPTVHIERRGNRRAPAEASLDTINIDTDEMVPVLYYRALLPLPSGLHDMAKAAVIMAHAPQRGPRSVAVA